MSTLTQETNEVTTNPTTPQRQYATPAVDIAEDSEGYTLHAEMPGVAKDGIEVSLDGNELTIVGHRTASPTYGNTLYRETRSVDYRRVFELDPAIDFGRISAEITQGLLTVRLPKAEKVKPRKISVAG